MWVDTESREKFVGGHWNLIEICGWTRKCYRNVYEPDRRPRTPEPPPAQKIHNPNPPTPDPGPPPAEKIYNPNPLVLLLLVLLLLSSPHGKAGFAGDHFMTTVNYQTMCTT